MATYSEVSLAIRWKLFIVWVQCKQLLQQQIPNKTFGIGEVVIFLLYQVTDILDELLF